MRSNTLVFVTLVLASPSLAWWTSEASPPCESETKTISHHVPHPSETTSVAATYPTEYPTYPTEKPTHTHSPKPTSSYEGVSTSETPTLIPTSYPEGPSLSLPETTTEVTVAESATETEAPTLSYPAVGASTEEAAPTSAAEGVSTYAPPPTGYSNGTVTSSQAPLSPSAIPTSTPSGITVPISGAGVAGWGLGSVMLGAVGFVFAML